MSIEQIIDAVQRLDGALVLRPGPGDGSPEVAWGDAFFYVAPDGVVPPATQPYGTIVTKDYPDDTASRLGVPDRWRVNVHVDRATFRALTGEDPASLDRPRDHAATDTVQPHPVYGRLGWVAVVTPGERTRDLVLELLRDAHEAARARATRRRAVGGDAIAGGDETR